MIKKVLKKWRRFLTEPHVRQIDRVQREVARLADSRERTDTHRALEVAGRVQQMVLWQNYRVMSRQKEALLPLSEVGFRVYSQTDEDGILLYIFGLIGNPHRTCVEVCCGSGIECNAANLIISHGWHGLLVDGNEAKIEQGKTFYRQCRDTWVFPPRLVHAWVTAENVNTLIETNGFSGEIDLLSIDVDGNDYWIWKAIDIVEPRVVVVEYQDILGPDRSCTMPYRPDFVASDCDVNSNRDPDYCGASLAAFVKLAQEKGYRLVGCNRYGFNAFFVRKGLGEDVLVEVSVESCFTHPKVREGMEMRFPAVANCEWQEV